MERNSLVVAVEMGRAQVFPLGPEPPAGAVLLWEKEEAA